MNDMLIDVVVLTKNSEANLEKCLKSIYDNIPINNLIIVDGYSTDRTLNIIQQFKLKYENVFIIKDHGTRATSRQKGIDRVKTDWFIFVDSDVVLCRNWYKKAKLKIEKNVGLIWGIEVWSTLKNRNTLKAFLVITSKIFNIRGGTHDTLIRTHLVKDIIIPAQLHVFEDAYLKNWITKKGYRAIPCYNPFCIHYRPEKVWTLKGSLKIIAESFKIGSFLLLLNLLPAYGFYIIYSIYQLLNQK